MRWSRAGDKDYLGQVELIAGTLGNKKMPKMWDKITKDYKDTPWAILAQRESMTALGLEWRAAKD